MKATNNPAPFRLLGFEPEDFEAWCEKEGKSPKSRDAKKEFFKLALEYKIIKKEGALIRVGKD